MLLSLVNGAIVGDESPSIMRLPGVLSPLIYCGFAGPGYLIVKRIRLYLTLPR
jgi:hypothetical protein